MTDLELMLAKTRQMERAALLAEDVCAHAQRALREPRSDERLVFMSEDLEAIRRIAAQIIHTLRSAA